MFAANNGTVINAALSVATVTSSPLFGLSKNYFLLTGIAGVNPKLGTIGAVTFAKFAVQVDTQLEFDGREIPSTWSTGYVPMGADSPESFPRIIHGSEVYELNDDLRQVCISFARTATLEDSAAAAEHRALYAGSPNGIYHAATLDPSIIAGDVASSNVFWHGSLLCEGMEKVFKIYTAGKVEYAMTASEDTAIMTALLRAALQKQVDFSRIILMRGGSNFDRSYSNSIPPSLPYILDQGGLEPAKRNLNLSGLNVVQGILEGWSTTFEHGIEANNYVGDVFGSLGGIPDFLPREKDL
ncbi:hypothetical protein G7Y89_g2279 [Cudoniella acicularis]|uniref:Purine nucleoside permease n=1 Tax=Cudoniella acicularis TaxID=354080 RepID=A0A8H4RTM2_9HELO|nr:hypothetical protein G7Y89_g2279 [Cudoniella acicularis]